VRDGVPLTGDLLWAEHRSTSPTVLSHPRVDMMLGRLQQSSTAAGEREEVSVNASIEKGALAFERLHSCLVSISKFRFIFILVCVYNSSSSSLWIYVTQFLRSVEYDQ
jgi:hypothetical protein